MFLISAGTLIIPTAAVAFMEGLGGKRGPEPEEVQPAREAKQGEQMLGLTIP